MSKVITKEMKTETITHKVNIVKAIKCDVCGKEFTGKYWRLITHHNDWGNDSIDSLEYYDLCSRECIDKRLDIYIKECTKSNTQHFELEQKRFIDEYVDEDDEDDEDDEYE